MSPSENCRQWSPERALSERNWATACSPLKAPDSCVLFGRGRALGFGNALDVYVHWTHAERPHQEPRKTPPAIHRLKPRMLAWREGEIDILPVPRVVHLQTMAPRFHRPRYL